jgi:predicted O-linked N-acetylglucosamine transferase (SPINDLY family)
MPHSPRVHAGRLWVLNSGCGSLELVDPANGRRDVVVRLPGYTRGLAFHGDYAFVGLSRIRETAVFGGIPIAEHPEQLKCGVGVIDLRTGQSVGHLEFEAGVEEIFDVAVVADARSVAVTGPYPAQDDAKDVWIVPRPRAADEPRAVSPVLLSDDQVTGLVRQAMQAQQEGRMGEAVETFGRAAGARPQSAYLRNLLGNAWQDFGRQDEAQACYEQALELEETFAAAHQNLGQLLISAGFLEQGRAHFERAQQLQPVDVNRVILATSLPIVYATLADVARHRERMLTDVDRLLADGVAIDTTHALAPTNFHAAYQGFDDCQLQRTIGRLYRAPQPVEKRAGRTSAGKVRVGFLSSHFCDHTIGRLNLGRIKLLDRRQFDVTLVALGHHDDPLAHEFRRSADRVVEPAGPLDAIRRQIAGLDLDVLVFADVGMNAQTYTLAMSRLAGVQCVTWGHPVTTGFESMDYFISGQWLETSAADAHYTERLVRLANLGTYYYRPKLEGQRTREAFGLDPTRHLYLCPQTLFKMHPEFDGILAEILRRDPAGELVLLASHRPGWTRLLEDRFARTMSGVVGRVRFLPMQPNADFLHLCALADVMLDPIHFGGGNTSYEGLAFATPIVTLPGQLLRGRITYALYRKMGVLDCLVETPEAYVERAVRLGNDRAYRADISRKIQAAADVLYEDPVEVRELERFLAWAAEGGPGQWQVPAIG